MLIDYVTDKYNWSCFSVVRCLYEGLQEVGHRVRLVGGVSKTTDADLVIVATSLKKLSKTKAPLVVLGFSDPNLFDRDRAKAADLYLTASKELSDKHGFPWLPSWSDSRYFFPSPCEKTADCVFMGVGQHPHVPERQEMVSQLRAAGLTVHVYGKLWPKHPDNFPFATGGTLVNAYRSAKMLVDLTNAKTALSSRIFQSMSCGTPVLTAERPDLHDLFVVGKDLVTYCGTKSLVDSARHLAKLPDMQRVLSACGKHTCIDRHDTKHRVKTLLYAVTRKFPRLG